MRTFFRSVTMGVFLGLGIFFLPFFILPMIVFFMIGSAIFFSKMRRFRAYQQAMYMRPITVEPYAGYSQKRTIEVF